jgi:D-beta-D-heptose 7-phosphate kinase/D-beta-D-heptose 1-phosphate adenosyltransferase
MIPLTAKVKTLRELLPAIAGHKQEGKKIVFTNGCYDLLHVGHVRCFKEARKLGDVLVVGLNSDRSVRALKGAPRPIVPEGERAEILAALECIDYVTIFDQDNPLDIIAQIKPDILVKGGDWTVETIVGRDIVESYGGKVLSLPLTEGVSTTAIVNDIASHLSKQP